MILIAAAIYFLIGLFLVGLWEAFDDSHSDIFILIVFFWPIALCALAIIVAVITPYTIGKWIGSKIKEWF